MLRLFTTAYPEADPIRRAEYAECISRNLSCEAINEVRIIAEGGAEDGLPENTKLFTRSVTNRPNYNDFFTWINELAEPDDVSLIANSDIYFDRGIGVAAGAVRPGECFALSRWDLLPEQSRFQHRNRSDSQDAWLLLGPIRSIAWNPHLGVPRCDNRIAHELDAAGYKLRNPSFSISAFHLHSAPPRLYQEAEHSLSVPPPYRYVRPENLWCWPRVMLHNWRHPEAKLGYTFDYRRWNPLRPIRAARFHLGALRRKLLRNVD